MPLNKQLSTNKQSQLPTLISSILVLVSPLGVAGQNLGLAVALVLFVLFCFSSGRNLLKSAISSQIMTSFWTLWLVIVLPVLAATIARGDSKEAMKFFFGYLALAPLPIMGLLLSEANINRKVLTNLTALVFAILALVAISQFLIGWKIEDAMITSQIKRAQGFYSHPLTLAYAALVVMPLAISKLFAHPSDWRSIVMGLAIFCIIICSQSITVIVVTVIVTAILAMRLLKLKQILVTSVIAAILGMAIMTTSNPISHKFEQVLQGQRGDHETPYPDDRMAFWHAHWEMFKDAPILGHGSGITRDLRQPYYEKIGLGHIKRMYEAHNMFLQLAVEGGILAALGFFAFLIWWFILAKQAHNLEPWQRIGYMMTPIAFAAGGLTQNALQDSEVRYLLFVMFSLTVASTARGRESQPHTGT